MLRDEKARQKAWAKGLDVNRRTKTAWRRLDAGETDEAPSMEDRKEWLGSFTDQGRNELAAWQCVPGGEATRVVFICNMHLHCPVRVRLLMTAQHGCTVQRNEADHTAEKNEFERANSPLTRAEQSDLAAAIRYGGGTAGKVKFEHESSALLKGAKRRENEEGGGVEGESGKRAMHRNALLCTCNACECKRSPCTRM